MTRLRGRHVAGLAAGGGLLLAVAVVVALVLLGYVAAPGVVPRANDRFERLTMWRGGGVGGDSGGVAVDPDGTYQRFRGAGEPAEALGSGRVDGDTMATIRGLATSPRLAAEARRPGLDTSDRCSDGFTTTIRMADFRMSVYDCADRPDVPTFRRLTTLLGRLG